MNKGSKSMSRREQVQKAGATVFIVTAVASVIVMFCLISIRFLWEKKQYNDRVITAKTAARDALDQNLTNLTQLAEQFPQLETSASTNSKSILHALPPTYDYAALASSIDYLATISGVSTSTSIGEDSSATAINSATTSKPVEVPLSLQVNGSYDAIKKYIENLQLSIRPIHIKDITFSGNNNSLQATVTAVAYYQPARSLEVEKRSVQ